MTAPTPLLLGLLLSGQLLDDARREGGPKVGCARSGTVEVAGIVLKWARGDREAGCRRAEPMIRQAAARGVKLVCATECSLDGYAIADKSIPLERYRALGEPIPDGEYCRRLMALADELDIVLVAGMLEARGEARSNTSVLIGSDGTLLGKNHKQKLGHEQVRITPGTESLVFPTPHGRAELMIRAGRTEPSIVEKSRTRAAHFSICPSGGMFGPGTNDPIVQARSRGTGRSSSSSIRPSSW